MKCPECGKFFKSHIRRHMQNVHKWSKNRSYSATAYNKYQITNQLDKPKTGRTTKGGKIDHHLVKKCPYGFCPVIRSRLGPHLIKHHGQKMGSEDYKKLLQLAQPWKGLADKEKREEVKDYLHRENVRADLGENIIPLFAETPATSIYIPESKENSQIMPMVNEDVIDCLDKANVVSTDAILVMFTRHMVSLDGGALDKVSADLYTQQIKTILTSLKTDDFTSLFDQQIMKCSFLNTKINDSRHDSLLPSTRQKYLTALLHFCDFVNQNESKFNVLRFTRVDILKMKNIFHNWRKSLNKQVQMHESVRNEDESKSIITPEQIAKWNVSEKKREAIKLLGQFAAKDPPALTRTNYCTMRDYFFVEIEIQNCHRSGVSSNMLVDEFHSAETETVNDNETFYIIKVKKHKTLRSKGKAKVYLKPSLYNHLKIFVEVSMNMIPGKDPHIFKSFNGRQLSSGEVSKQLDSVWQSAHQSVQRNEKPKRINCTTFRKSISTLVLEHDPSSSSDVANLLAHGKPTQEKYYDVRRRDKSSAKGASTISRIFKNRSSNLTDQTLQSTSSAPSIPSSPRKRWSTIETNELKELFSDLLKEESDFTLQTIKDKENHFQYLKDVPCKKIYDKVRSMQRYKDQASLSLPSNSVSTLTKVSSFLENSPLSANSTDVNSTKSVTVTEKAEVDAEHDSDDSSGVSGIPPTETSSCFSKEKKFSGDDMKIIAQHLTEVMKYGPRTPKPIQVILSKTEEGRNFLKKHGIDAVVNRVKYEKRKLDSQKK